MRPFLFIFLCLGVAGGVALGFAQEAAEVQEEGPPKVDQAVRFRNNGLKLQKKGDAAGAIALYQEALTHRPDFVTVYNNTVPDQIKDRNNQLLGRDGWGNP